MMNLIGGKSWMILELQVEIAPPLLLTQLFRLNEVKSKTIACSRVSIQTGKMHR